MVHYGLTELPLPDTDVPIMENAGNLVCPSEFKVGGDVRVTVCAITEGVDECCSRPQRRKG